MSIYAAYFELTGLTAEENPELGRVSSYTDNQPVHFARHANLSDYGVMLAYVPSYCWPNGNDDESTEGPTAPWLRVSVAGYDSGLRSDEYASVNIDVQAARKLGQALLEWAGEEHADDL